MQPLYHALFMGSFAIPILLIVYFAIRNRKQEVEPSGYSAGTLIQMSLQYVIGYNVVFFIQELFLVLGKNWIGLTAYLYHNNHNWDGHDPKAALMQGSGALAIFIFGLLMVMTYHIIRNRDVSIWMKTMILWFGLHGLMQSLPQVTTAFVATQTDTGQAFAYLGVEGINGFMFALTSVGLTILFSWWFFIQFADLGLFSAASKKSQFVSVLKIIGLPLVIGSLLIIPFRIMPWDRGFNQFFNLIPWLPWFFVFAGKSLIAEKQVAIKPEKLVYWFTIAIGILLLFQLLLAPGVRFDVR